MKILRLLFSLVDKMLRIVIWSCRQRQPTGSACDIHRYYTLKWSICCWCIDTDMAYYWIKSHARNMYIYMYFVYDNIGLTGWRVMPRFEIRARTKESQIVSSACRLLATHTHWASVTVSTASNRIKKKLNVKKETQRMRGAVGYPFILIS